MSDNSVRWFVVINPVAGKGRGLLDWPYISKLLRDNGIAYDAVFSEKKYHSVELTVEAIGKSYRKILVVGGDGTLHEVVNGIFLQKNVPATDITIGVIPVGSGNDWVRMFGIRHKYSDSIRAIVKGRSIVQDCGELSYYESKVNHTRFMANMAGLGLDGYVNQRYTRIKEQGRVTGRLTYIVTLIRSLFTYRPIPMKIWIDGELTIEDKILTGVVAIGKYNGGGMLQAPHAVVDDGLFDVTFICRGSSLTVLRYFKSLFNGSIYDVPNARYFQCKSIRIESPKGIVEVDGEPLGTSPFHFELKPKQIRIIVGEEYGS